MLKGLESAEYGDTREAQAKYLEEVCADWWRAHREAVEAGDQVARKEAHDHILMTRLHWVLLRTFCPQD